MLNEEQVVACTAAYIVSKKATSLLMANAFPMSTQLDHALSGAAVSGLRRAVYIPSLAQVGNQSLKSDVQLPRSGILTNLISGSGYDDKDADDDFKYTTTTEFLEGYTTTTEFLEGYTTTGHWTTTEFLEGYMH